MLSSPFLPSQPSSHHKAVVTWVSAGALVLCALSAPAHANGLETILGGGVGAAAGAILGQQVGGRQGAVIGGAIGGATGAAVSTQGSGRNGAVLGGAVGGAAGAVLGQSTGGRNGAVLGAGIGAAAGATIGKGVTQRPPDYRDYRGYSTQHPYAQGVYVQPAGYYAPPPPRYGWDRRDERRDHWRHREWRREAMRREEWRHGHHD